MQDFVGSYEIPYPLLGDRPSSQGLFAMPDAYYEIKVRQIQALEAAEQVFADVARAYALRFGRHLGAVESYRMDGAERAIVLIGSTAGTAKDVVDELRERGERVGLVAVRLFRPFPHQALEDALATVGRVAVLDRAAAPGTLPPLFADIRAGYHGTAELRSYVYGLGGRDTAPEDIAKVYRDLQLPAHAGIRYLGLLGEDQHGES